MKLDERLEHMAAADKTGFYAYHVAGHHATPLDLVPVSDACLGAWRGHHTHAVAAGNVAVAG